LVPEPAGVSQYTEAIEERQAGVVFHEDRAAAARQASSRQALWWAVLLALVGVALLLVRALLEGRR
jgi:4-hydroxybenzoate polyprenyltransferase